MKVLLGPSTFAELDASPLSKLEGGGCRVVKNPYGRKLTKQEILELLTPDVHGLIAGLETLDAEVLEKSRLKVISRCGSGMANVDLKAAERLGIRVCSTPQGPTHAVAELAIGSLLSLLRSIPQMNQSMHDKKWEKRIGDQIEGKTAVIIGYGRIGRRVAHLLRAFGADIIAVDPALPASGGDVRRLSLDKALPMADIVTLHCDGQSTLLGKREFSLMKKGSYLLNAARGELIDEDTLAEALDSGRLAGAWIDTFTQEPYEGRLCGHPRVLLTPHVGSYTKECRRAMEMEAVENLLNAFKGIP